ncbi:TRAP transporter small permease [Stappia sp. ES.058]|uniref:TRAP transporter small permease n=1 Tax=Stappia sp. ES.058 TaxID=1881061 RepID=UPI00087DCBB0|nr:TRAP transporter small permease [Stappia sp. ES.058]SDU15485.1 TRAP-type C4-dicarboxylate transport system, small permease component [Stappia sp. ES.058]
MHRLAHIHDRTSRGLFLLAGCGLVAATALYVFEVVARYVFDAPTTWSGEAVQYALAVVIFCALPEITRTRAHVAIDLVPEAAGPRAALWLGRFNLAVAATACGVSGWIVAGEAVKQFQRGLMTNAANPIPRWWITAVIALGLSSAAVHLARQLAETRRQARGETHPEPH